RTKNAQAFVIDVFQRISVARRGRTARTGLHIVPPSVISATKPHQVALTGVISGKPNGLHDRFSARHVERNFGEAGYLPQTFSITEDAGMVPTKSRAECRAKPDAFCHALFVKIDAEYVHAVRTSQVVIIVSVKIAQLDALGKIPKRSQ